MNPTVTPERINAAYDRLGYGAGWRFMTCPQRNFGNPKVLLVSLNPSGRVEHGPRWSQEDGSAYVIEGWGNADPGQSPLQVQIQRMVAQLGVNWDEVASAHFVPFRSQRWADLDHPREAVDFAKGLWADFVYGMRPDHVICLGTTVGQFVPSLFGMNRLARMPTGWGNITLGVGCTRHGGQLTVLPHLGTFKLFSRVECAPFMKAAFSKEGSASA